MRRLAAMLMLLAPAPALAQAARDALEAGDLICEIRHAYRRDVLADIAYRPQLADLMLVFESLGAPAPRVVSSQRPGRHAVQVRVTGNAVHFIEPVGPSVRQTTLTGCAQTTWKNGFEQCVRFAARHAWHFDNDVYADPDAALARLAQSASSGVCEPWQMD